MINQITPDRIANSILQDHSFNGTYILVEGNNDYTLYRKFVNNDLCEIQIAFGKENILETIEILKKRGYLNCIGILDSDFRNLSDPKPNSIDNVFFTDNHDLETTLLDSDAFDSLIDTYCEIDKLNAFMSENGNKNLKTILLDLITPLAYLKWANQKEKWGLLFKSKNIDGPELKIEDFIQVSTMRFSSLENMTKIVFNYSRGKAKISIDEATVVEKTRALYNKSTNAYQLCNGHDFAYVFSLSLRKKVATYNSKSIAAEQIEKNLVLAYDSSFFKGTSLYSNLKEWEKIKNKILLKF